MRNRRMDGQVVVFLGLLALAAAARAAPPADLDTIVANNERAVTQDRGTSGIRSLELHLRMQDHGITGPWMRTTRSPATDACALTS